jgi:hypothetical protein
MRITSKRGFTGGDGARWHAPGGWHGTVEQHPQDDGVKGGMQTWREWRDGLGEAQGPPDDPKKAKL